jgi:hypothetical protein
MFVEKLEKLQYSKRHIAEDRKASHESLRTVIYQVGFCPLPEEQVTTFELSLLTPSGDWYCTPTGRSFIIVEIQNRSIMFRTFHMTVYTGAML